MYVTIAIIALILAVCSIASIFRDTENRFLKMLDFTRIQLFLTSFLCLIILAITAKKWKWYDYLLITAILIGLVTNGAYLINYTPLVPVAVPFAKDLKSTDEQFTLLIANVKMSNKNSQELIKLIELKNPDLILAMEVNKWWDGQLKAIENKYPYSQHTINEVAYGMVLYSKFPIKELNVNYLQNKNVPSFESIIELPKGKIFSFYCVHPVPPTHFKNLPDNEGQQESAFKILGKEISSRQYPTLLAGDLNDVVWSHVDKLTGTQNILYDVRVGRGFFNSYNAENIFMKWPLDHIFVTNEFRLKSLIRLQDIGSDHYPIFATLVL